jgi:hypothetical protein
MLWIRAILVSGSPNLYHLLLDPDPAIFVRGFQNAKKKFFFDFFCLIQCCGSGSVIRDWVPF